jgi:hypothetical protein
MPIVLTASTMGNEESGVQLTLREASNHHEQLLKSCKSACITLKTHFRELDPCVQQLLLDSKPRQQQEILKSTPYSDFT